ncbi:MAG: PLP-dependent aminotransferase family protein [Oscillospiraceae bacterium]|jgi:2-aminoadipate transaminase|nr:PLP-dependent aminotransferase family protein [Oscillospiraceae bacterium]
MEYQFSRRVLELKPSAIREIFKYAADPQVISLSAGNPAPEAFPTSEISKISAQILAERPIDALQYGTTEGYTPLRRHLTEYLKEKSGIGTERDDLIITSGAQQIMDLFAKSVIDTGDTVLCESPSFLGALNTYRSYRAKLRGVPMEADGMSLEGLEQALKEEKRTKFIYTIPNFQNPTGATMSLAKRHGMYELAKKYGVMILEDNPYGDLRFAGEALPAIKSFDTEGIVLYAGTFSKVVAPGIRVGFAVGPKPVLQKMIVCKQGEDVHTNNWAQILCDELLTNYDFDSHLNRLRGVYRKKSKVAVDAMNRWLLPKITYQPIEGGLFFWCTLPEGSNMLEFVKRSIEHKVCVVPGNAFLTDDTKPSQSFRINYTTPTDENLVRGIQLLGEVACDMIP